jgi:hypothetical protein
MAMKKENYREIIVFYAENYLFIKKNFSGDLPDFE